MAQLTIPYRSQWDPKEANNYYSDCGPTCVAMVLNYHGIQITPNQIYAQNFPAKKKTEFTNTNELIGVLKRYPLDVGYRQASSKAEALRKLKLNVDAGRQMIALVKYQPWRQVDTIKHNDFNGGHFVVITGYDADHIYMHDPLFGLWVKPAEKGSHFPMLIDQFCAGWGGFGTGNNPNWAYLLVLTTRSNHEQTATPIPVPTPPALPPAEPEPTPESPTFSPTRPPHSKTMSDIKRRIRALAAFRWAEEPNLNDQSAATLWQTHLGDWGLTYQEHVVRPGDSYTVLAEHYYGETYRWPGIRAYNTFQHEGLWVGETVLIPNLGNSGAHLNTALPSDEINITKSVDMDDLIDPDHTAMNYEALWDDSINLGYVEPEG